MSRKLHRAVRKWLRYEQQGRDDQADKALIGVFRHLPAPPLPEGFADRLSARAGLTPVASSAYPWAAVWGLRAGVGVCLTVMALFLMVLPSYLPALLGIVNPGRATEVGVSALVAVLQQLGIGLVIWQAFSSIGSILSATLSSPPYVAALLMGVLVSMGALRILHDLILSERSSEYVGSA